MSKQLKTKKLDPPTSRVVKTIRISTFHNLMFSQMPGKEYPGLLIRLLLDKYFAHELPDVEKKFQAEVQKKHQERLRILSEQTEKNKLNKVIIN